MQGKGGHAQWSSYSATDSSGGTGSPRSSMNLRHSSSASAVHITSSSSRNTSSPTFESGYAPATEVLETSQEHTRGVTPIITCVRALYTFNPTEPEDLSFEKGDVIKVVDQGDGNWWRGTLRGRTGAFPVNYVVSIVYSQPVTAPHEYDL